MLVRTLPTSSLIALADLALHIGVSVDSAGLYAIVRDELGRRGVGGGQIERAIARYHRAPLLPASAVDTQGDDAEFWIQWVEVKP